MSQYLDRKEVIELYEKYQPYMANRVYDFGEALRKLPVVEERPCGEWKYESYGQYLSTYKCSNCGFHGDKQWICCPYCGADMREGEKE